MTFAFGPCTALHIVIEKSWTKCKETTRLDTNRFFSVSSNSVVWSGHCLSPRVIRKGRHPFIVWRKQRFYRGRTAEEFSLQRSLRSNDERSPAIISTETLLMLQRRFRRLSSIVWNCRRTLWGWTTFIGTAKRDLKEFILSTSEEDVTMLKMIIANRVTIFGWK